jgi:hypothetical protein
VLGRLPDHSSLTLLKNYIFCYRPTTAPFRTRSKFDHRPVTAPTNQQQLGGGDIFFVQYSMFESLETEGLIETVAMSLQQQLSHS